VSHAFASAPLLQLDALTREMENGRLFRLVSKLAFVTDRNSSDVGAASGDTGNSYLLQLFRDFVFHQGERDGGRVIDWGHIVENLNKVRKAGGARDASQGVLGTLVAASKGCHKHAAFVPRRKHACFHSAAVSCAEGRRTLDGSCSQPLQGNASLLRS
jgi:hypothetical protein